MTLMQLVDLLRSAIDGDHPPEVLREITDMIEKKTEEGVQDYGHMHLRDYIEYQKAQGMKQKDLAAKAGLHSSQISQILGGQKPNLSLKVMLQIVKATNGAVNRVEDFQVEPSP